MIYNSRNNFYKYPTGAVLDGETVTFKIKLPSDLNATNICLCVAKDGSDFEYIPMYFIKVADGYGTFEAEYKFDKGAAPYWYFFKITTKYGDRFVSKHFGGEGKITHEVFAFQQTVASSTYKIPSWYGEGITYNIFPDRFNRTEVPKPMKNRVVHENWDDIPVYLPDENGEILNNDFFGGNLQGIIEKLDYLKSLSVATIYLNPIFKAYSNHRYDTGDYKTIDEYVGTEEDFKELCQKAKDKGIRIILDGVFSHTGYDSLYFNGKNNYDSVGAFNSQSSPYYNWYSFKNWNKEYQSWWGIYTLPEVNELNEDFMNYIINDKDSVLRKWLELGASGYRLDVADELPDEFINELNKVCKQTKNDAIVIGEVWEDASNKEAYSKRRQYVYGQYLDSVMNYVLKDAIIEFLLNGSAENFRESIETMKENYPKDFFYSLMNIIGTHDTKRILTTLSKQHFESRGERAHAKLSDEQRKTAVLRMKIASLLSYSMPGSPCLYYGDEVGMEGYEDPMNRGTYPWGKEDKDILDFFVYLGKLRSENECMINGDLEFLFSEGNVLIYRRKLGASEFDFYINKAEYRIEFEYNGTFISLDRLQFKIYENGVDITHK